MALIEQPYNGANEIRLEHDDNVGKAVENRKRSFAETAAVQGRRFFR